MAPKPMNIAAAVAMNCKARKKMRPMTPISAPIATSETMSERTMAEGILARVARSDGSSIGASASVTASAMNRRTCAGTRALEKPGISIRQPPIRQKSRKTSRTVSGPIGLMRSCPAT